MLEQKKEQEQKQEEEEEEEEEEENEEVQEEEKEEVEEEMAVGFVSIWVSESFLSVVCFSSDIRSDLTAFQFLTLG